MELVEDLALFGMSCRHGFFRTLFYMKEGLKDIQYYQFGVSSPTGSNAIPQWGPTKKKKKNINGSLEWLVDKRETSGLFKMKQGIKVY